MSQERPPCDPDNLHSLKTPLEVQRYYEMLAEEIHQINLDPTHRGKGITRQGREDLCRDHEIEFEDNTKLGYYFVNYDKEDPQDHFPLFIRQQAELFKKTLIGKDTGIGPPYHPGTNDWKVSFFYKFLLNLIKFIYYSNFFSNIFQSN